MAILPLFFQYRYILFYFLVWLLSLGLPILCWTKWWEWASCLISDFSRNGFSFSLMSIMLAVSLSCRAFYCALFPLFPLWWEFLSWIDVEFYLMIFLHLFRWSCGFCGVSCVSCDHVFLWCFMWCIALTDLHVLNHPCDPGMNPTWSWHMVLFMCCWTQFANVLFRILASILIKDIGLCIYFWECICLVLESQWLWSLRMTLGMFLFIQYFGRVWKVLV